MQSRSLKRSFVKAGAYLTCLSAIVAPIALASTTPPIVAVPACPVAVPAQQYYGRVYFCKSTLDCPPWANDRKYFRVCSVTCCYPSGSPKYVLTYKCGNEFPDDGNSPCCTGGVGTTPPPPASVCP